MKQLRFSGHSDDVFQVDGGANEDMSDEAYGKPAAFRIDAVSDTGEAESLIVTGHYAPHAAATWAIGVALADEGIPLPSWPMRFEREHEYSHALVVTVPDNATVVAVTEEEE